jgi:hypothetical protein
MQSGQNASFGLLPGGADFWISVVLVQARFDYRFFLFAKFPVIKPRFTIEFIQLGPNFPPLFRIESGFGAAPSRPEPIKCDDARRASARRYLLI